jgi:pyruvate formate lyase activating enzyme
MKDLGIWLEVTTLVIPEINDDEAELRDVAKFIAQELGPGTPWHISRFFPYFKMVDHTSTPEETLRRVMEIGLEEGLHYVYIGNVGGYEGNVTKCSSCQRILIRRSQFGILANHIEQENLCSYCEQEIEGVGLVKQAHE